MSGPHPALARARKALRDLPLPARPSVLVAYSGGQDSLALLAASCFVAERDNWRLRAVTIDHQLRDTSAADAQAAAALAARLGVPCDIHRVQIPGGAAGRGHGGPEAAARQARYRALTAAAKAADADAVLLGHTQDDQAEGVLLALARGAGARSLAGMRPRVGIWYRPLLGHTRAETAAICAALDLPPVIDPSNDPDGPWRAADGKALKRSALRAEVMPLLRDIVGPHVGAALARSASQLRRDDDALRQLADAALRAAQLTAPAGEIRVQRSVLRALHPAVRTRVLHHCAQQLAGKQVVAVQVADMDRLLMDNAVRGPVFCADAVMVSREGETLRFHRRED